MVSLEFEIRGFGAAERDFKFIDALGQRVRDRLSDLLELPKKLAVGDAVGTQYSNRAAEGLIDSVRDGDHRACACLWRIGD